MNKTIHKKLKIKNNSLIFGDSEILTFSEPKTYYEEMILEKSIQGLKIGLAKYEKKYIDECVAYSVTSESENVKILNMECQDEGIFYKRSFTFVDFGNLKFIRM